MSNGKGSVRRPAAVSEEEQRERWAQTFGKIEMTPMVSNGFPDQLYILHGPLQWLDLTPNTAPPDAINESP